ncbi:MAG TPA: hypothetical protein VN963_02015 [bacterium]|nr:hypothetical protein [bacterium]
MGSWGVLFLSIPFYFLWNYLIPIYAYQLPSVYRHISFWHCAGLFALVAVIRMLLFPPRWFWRGNYKNGCGR